MSMPRTVVFGDDGSPNADVAWLFINSQSWQDWSVEVVTAQMPAIIGAVLPSERVELHSWDPPTPRVAFPGAGFAQVAHLTAESDPRIVLSRDCDLLVIGPRGTGFLKSLHLGSTADWLLLRPPAPLLIARHGKPTRNTVVCVDGSTHADKVTETIATLPWAEHLAVTVLAVEDSRTDVNTAVSRTRERLEPVVATVQVQTYSGRPTEMIHRHLADTSPDLVALGTRGLTGLKLLRLGSTASAIARSASCSVLLACDSAGGA